MTEILISTLYEKKESTILSIRTFDIKKVFLLLDKDVKAQQRKSLSEIKKLFGYVVEFIEKKIDVYDILNISKEVTDIIDSIKKDDDIFVDISQSRKTQALGVLFSCYARYDRIKKIVYWNEEDKKLIVLPKLSFHINGNNKRILEKIETIKNLNELANSIKVSRTMLYRYIKNLLEKGLLEKEEDKYKVTDAGKIAIL
ncbi:MAG: CRISPR-associated CARF protein Csa3 [Candidatus Aenigmatarchaeota archaeon]